jgi:Predicted membrane protein
METIKNYLDNMFKSLPKTEEISNLKNDIYENMQDKYQELKANGKSENEAIGIVISEFGNIEEILDAFGISYEANKSNSSEEKEQLPEVTLEIANEYIRTKKTAGLLIGIGVMMCIIGAAMVMLIQAVMRYGIVAGNANSGYTIGVIIMFVMVAGGVALFIYTGFLLEPYNYLNEQFNISQYVKAQLSEEWSVKRPYTVVKLTIGICLCVISPIPVLLTNVVGERGGIAEFGTSLLLCVVAIGVYFIIGAGNIMGAYNCLLEIGDYTPAMKKGNKVIEIVASIIWPLATAAYLVLGFGFGLWHPGWIIFPIVGILFGIFSGVVEEISKK